MLSNPCDRFIADFTQITAIIAIILVSILNLISRSMGTNSAIFISSIKLGALLFVAVLGVISLIRHGAGPALAASGLFAGMSTQPSSYAIALYSGLWAFDGWDACCVCVHLLELEVWLKCAVCGR